MIEIKTSNLNQENASFVFNNDININEEDTNLILFDIKDEKDLKKVKSSFGKIISGVNRSKAVFCNGERAFDNELYFGSRIYIDTKIKYANNLSEEKISNLIIGEYGKAFDDKCFKNLVHDLMIRSHYKNHNFDSVGLTLFGLSLAVSTYTNSIINLDNNDCISLQNVLNKKNNLIYGLTVLTKCEKDAINEDLLKHFSNVFLVTKSNESNGINIVLVEKETLKQYAFVEANYEE